MEETLSTNDFEQIESILKTDSDIRRKVVTKLEKLVDGMHIDINNFNSKALEAQMGVVSTMDSLMKSIESGQFNLEKLKLGKTNNALANDIQEKVTTLLSSIIPTQIIPIDNNVEQPSIEILNKEINEEFKESDLDISDDEITVIK